MGHVHTKSNSYALTRVTDQIIWMSLSGVCLECRMRIQPLEDFVAIYILPLSPPGGITVVYIYRRIFEKQSYNAMHIKFVLEEFVAIYILPLSPPGGITVVYIYRRIFQKQSYNALQREDFPGRGFSWGAVISEKTGLGKLLGEVF